MYEVKTNRAWVHWQESQDQTWVSRPISYEELVKRAGVNFLPGGMPKS